MYQHRKLFRALVVVGLVAGAAKCFRHRAWKMAGGPEGEFSAKHWQKSHRHKPGLQDWEKPSAEETEGPELSTEAFAARA